MKFYLSDIPKSLTQSGIYAIINTLNNKRYIGHTSNFYQRFCHHRNDLKGNKHRNSYLQNSFNVHGTNIWMIEILEYYEYDDDIYLREQYWIDYYESYNRDKGYNRGPCARNGFKGAQHTNKTKLTISQKITGIKRTQEFKENLSQKLTGRKRKQWEIDKIKQGIIEKGAHDKEKKQVTLVSPEGKIIEVFGIKEFCREYNLDRGNILKLLRGKRPFLAGWRIYDGTNGYPMAKFEKGKCSNLAEHAKKVSKARQGVSNKKKWTKAYFISNSGQIFETDNLSELAREMGIKRNILANLFHGRRKEYNGLKFLKTE